MSAPKRLIDRVVGVWLAVLVLLRLRRARRKPEPDVDPEREYGTDPSPEIEAQAGVEREADANPGAEIGVALALLLAGASGVAFCLIYALDKANTQLLGVAIGVALLAVAAALILAANRVFPQETAAEPRPVLAEHREQEEADVTEEFTAGADGLTRRRMLLGAAGAAGTGLAAAALTPLASLGPDVGLANDTTPWKDGTVLVDESGTPISATEVIQGSFITAFPQGADMRELGSPIVVVRVEPATLRLPAGRSGWAPRGILAYSKICTHAGCAVSLYRSPLNQQTSAGPALVCPCHYSTFNVLDGASVEFGPAGRPLPQLPLAIRSDEILIATGGFSGPIGPAWWSVRREGPTKAS